MKRIFKILSIVLCSIFLTSIITVNAENIVPDLSLSNGKLSYSEAKGLSVQATATEYTIRDTTKTPYYGFSVQTEIEGDFKVAITNEHTSNQSFSLKIITATENVDTERISVAVGSNVITVDNPCTGKTQEVKFVFDAFFYLNCTLIVEGITDLDGNAIWTPTYDNWTKDENPYVTSNIFYSQGNMLTGTNLDRTLWYTATFNMGVTDWTNYEGFSLEVDTTITGKEVYFNKYFIEYNGTDLTEKWYAPDTATFYCYQANGGAFKMTGNLIPAFFKGTIVVPFDTFELPDWNKAEFTGNGVKDLNNTDGIIGITFEGAKGDFSIGMKNCRLVEQVEDIETVIENQGDIKFIDNMSSYDSTQTANYAWRTNWSLASPCQVELVVNPSNAVGATGNALKITPLDAPKNPTPDPNTGLATATGYTALELFPTGGTFDISGSKGITFFVKNLESSPFYISCEFDILQDGMRQRWQVKQYGRYILYDTETHTQKIFNAFNGIYIPADFCGFVRIAYSQLRNPSWETVGGDFTDGTGLVYFVLNIDTNQFAHHSFIFDSLGVYSEEVQIKTMFNTPEKDIVSVIGGAN